MNILYVDLECFAGEKPSIDELKVPGNISKPESIKKWKEDPENLEDAWKKQALDVLQCQVVCIGYAFEDGEVKTICGKDEKEVMANFVNAVTAQYPQRDLDTLHWVAHSGLTYDFPILWHRLRKYSLNDIMPPREAKNQFLDTMKMAGYSDFKSMLSLKKLAKFYGLGGKLGSGSDVHQMFLDGKLIEIAAYCGGDVGLLRKLYKILK